IGSKRSRKATKGLREDAFEGRPEAAEPLDLLDVQKTRSALASQHPKTRSSDDSADVDAPEIDSEGRMIIRDDDDDDDKVHRQKAKKNKSTVTEADGKVEDASRKPTTRKRARTSEKGTGWCYVGKEYASEKARGDVRRKDKLEPYAYWPLDRKMLSRRPEHRVAARKGMANVAKLRKKVEGKSVANALSVRALVSKKRK
ncbi:hypothetical protein M569_16916, partial [Genlisea aurea]